MSFNWFTSYLLQKKLVCVAKRIAARAEIQAKALIPISGLIVILVARLKADRALVLSNMSSSVNPAVLLSTKERYFIKSKNEPYVIMILLYFFSCNFFILFYNSNFILYSFILAIKYEFYSLPGLDSANFMSARSSLIFLPFAVTMIRNLIILVSIRILSLST